MGGEGNKSVVRHRMAGQKGEAGDGAKVLAQVRARSDTSVPNPHPTVHWHGHWDGIGGIRHLSILLLACHHTYTEAGRATRGIKDARDRNH